METTFQHFSRILDDIIEDSPYYKWFFSNMYACEYGENLGHGVSMAFGAMRACLIDENWDEVVKFTVHQDDGDSDPCERELENYKCAVSYGVQQYFTKCNFIGVYRNSYTWYDHFEVSELVTPDPDDDDWLRDIEDCHMVRVDVEIPLYAYEKASDTAIKWSLTPDEETFVESNNSPLVSTSPEVGCMFREEYGDEAFAALSDFCSDCGINDLHTGNIGRVDGKLVITDYASCFGW